MISPDSCIALIESPDFDFSQDFWSRATALCDWIKEDVDVRGTEDALAEYFALAVMGNESLSDKQSCWPGYFQPMFRFGGSENPGYTLATASAIPYWTRRMEETGFPYLRARYADLVIDFSQRLAGRGAHNDVRQLYVDAVLEVADGTTSETWHQTQQLLRRALKHATALRSEEIWQRLGDAVMRVDKIMVDAHGHLPSFSLELLRHKHIQLSEEHEHRILAIYEAALDPPSQGGRGDFFATDHAVEDLTRHYKASKFRENRLSIIRRFEAYTAECYNRDSGMRADRQWENVQLAYAREQDQEGVNRALAHRKRAQKASLAEMRTIEVPFEIDKKSMEDLLNTLCEGEPRKWLVNFAAFHGLPNPLFDKQVEDQGTESSIMDIIPTVSLDNDGRPLTSGSKESLGDDDKTMLQINQYLSEPWTRILLEQHIERLSAQSWYTPGTVASFLFVGEQIERDETIVEALRLYFAGYHLAFVHMAVPRLERLIRLECERLELNTRRQNSAGGIDYRLLNELLALDGLHATFHPQFLLYLRCLFTEKHGLNYRNDLLHSITPGPSATSKDVEEMSNRILHALCAVALYTQAARAESDSPEPSADH